MSRRQVQVEPSHAPDTAPHSLLSCLTFALHSTLLCFTFNIIIKINWTFISLFMRWSYDTYYVSYRITIISIHPEPSSTLNLLILLYTTNYATVILLKNFFRCCSLHSTLLAFTRSSLPLYNAESRKQPAIKITLTKHNTWQ